VRVLRIESVNVTQELMSVGDLSLHFSLQIRNISLVVSRLTSLFHAIAIDAYLLTVTVIRIQVLSPAPHMRRKIPVTSVPVGPDVRFCSGKCAMKDAVVRTAD